MKPGCVIWVTGLPSSGKTTIALAQVPLWKCPFKRLPASFESVPQLSGVGLAKVRYKAINDQLPVV